MLLPLLLLLVDCFFETLAGALPLLAPPEAFLPTFLKPPRPPRPPARLLGSWLWDCALAEGAAGGS